MKQLMPFERRDLLRWVFAVLCGGWLVGALWYVLAGAPPRMAFDGNAYMPYERRLAACNELRTSQERYDCTTRLMLGRDRSLFGKVSLVVGPPLAALAIVAFVGYGVRRRRERERERAAHDLAQAQMEAYREKLAQQEAEIASGLRKEEMFLDDDGELVEAPPRLARWKD